MFKLAREKTRSLLDLHGWTAIILGLLLYAVVVTGTVAVLAEPIEHWSIGEVRSGHPMEAGIDGVVRSLAGDVDRRYLEDIGLWTSPGGNLIAFFHEHRAGAGGAIEEYGVEFEVDPASGRVLEERTGSGPDLHHTHGPSSLARFLVAIHTELHLPQPWGLLLTGVLGLAMLVGAVSGFLVHRHLFVDLFTLRRDRSSLLAKRDLHTVAGTWGLPFAFILAFTGSFFSFAGSFGIPAMSMVAFGGDQEAMIRTLIGAPKTQSDEAVSPSSLDSILADARSRAGGHPQFVSISHWGRGDSTVTLSLPPSEGTLEPIQLEYSGVNGELVREKPVLGVRPSLGSAAFALVGPLHFGNFAGWLSQTVWVALGFAASYVILSGLGLWIERRREDRRWALFERMTTVFGAGLPCAMLVSALSYFAVGLLHTDDLGWRTDQVVRVGFCAAALAAIVLGFLLPARTLRITLLRACALLCVLLPLFRLWAGGPLWGRALEIGNVPVIAIDMVLVLSGLFCETLLRRQRWREVTALANRGDETDRGRPQPVAAV